MQKNVIERKNFKYLGKIINGTLFHCTLCANVAISQTERSKCMKLAFDFCNIFRLFQIEIDSYTEKKD